MHALLRFRSVSFALIVLFDVLNIAFAAWNLTVMGPTSASVGVYTLTVSAIGLLVVGGMIVMEQRTGSPRLWLEMAWVAFFALLSLGSAATTTALLPVAACGTMQVKTNHQFCTSSNALVATNWLAAITYLSWFIIMIIHGITRSFYDRDVWIKGIKDVERLDNASDAALNEKIVTLPTLHDRPETRTSGYSVSSEKEKSDTSIVMSYQYRNGPIGVDAINGAPVYHPYNITNTWSNVEQGGLVTPALTSIGNLGPTGSPQTVEVPPRRPFFVAPSYAMSTGGSSTEINANAGSNPSSGFEWINTAYKNTASPSPAIIMQVHKVPAQQALYGAGTDGHRRTRSNTDPTRGQWFPPRGKTNQSNVVLVDDRRPSEGGVGQTPQAPFRMGHAPSLSTDSALGVGTKKPKHRPPPLDLSRLSNVKQAEKR